MSRKPQRSARSPVIRVAIARKVPHFGRSVALAARPRCRQVRIRICPMIGAVARKLFGSSNDRRIRKLSAAGRRDQRAGDGTRDALRRGAARAHRRVQEAGRRRHVARRHSGAGLRDRARGGQAHARPAPFRRAADRRHDPARGQDLRDEDRRRQDAGRDACRSISTRSPAAACTSSPSTTTSPSATPSGWARSTSSSG